MEHGGLNVIYLDRRGQEGHVGRDGFKPTSSLSKRENAGSDSQGHLKLPPNTPPEVAANLETLLSTFHEVYVFCSASPCLAKIAKLDDNKDKKLPTIVLIDIPYEEEQRLKRLSREPRHSNPATPRKTATEPTEGDDLYGIHFLTHISSEIQSKNLSRLVIPVAVLSGFDRDQASSHLSITSGHGSQVLTDSVRLMRYLDAGAADVVISPLSKDHTQSLSVHAYRTFKEVIRDEQGFLAKRRARKRSWVGVNEDKPFAYLREAMVSNLMSGICEAETIADALDPADILVTPERKSKVEAAVGSWAFAAHDFTDDELLYGALVMLEHALQMKELEQWRISREELIIFLLASRMAYNDFVFYHNFRHVADVLQAVFFFLVQIGALPPFPNGSPEPPGPKSAIPSLILPFDALTLLISAIGHDVGHPGVNNAFLVALNAPLAQLYNDRSVLESFHCAAYSQILRRYWPHAFADVEMRKRMISAILATDMGLHFKYMADLGNLQEKLAHNGNTVEGWNAKILDEYRDLACGLLIKCADISNVARKFDTARKWAEILTDEFSNQGQMEKELEMATCLFSPPEPGNLIKLGESQIGFINLFARPLFEQVSSVMPNMSFSIDELSNNKEIWNGKIEAEKGRLAKASPSTRKSMLSPAALHDMSPSPMTRSIENLADDARKQSEVVEKVDAGVLSPGENAGCTLAASSTAEHGLPHPSSDHASPTSATSPDRTPGSSANTDRTALFNPVESKRIPERTNGPHGNGLPAIPVPVNPLPNRTDREIKPAVPNKSQDNEKETSSRRFFRSRSKDRSRKNKFSTKSRSKSADRKPISTSVNNNQHSSYGSVTSYPAEPFSHETIQNPRHFPSQPNLRSSSGHTYPPLPATPHAYATAMNGSAQAPNGAPVSAADASTHRTGSPFTDSTRPTSREWSESAALTDEADDVPPFGAGDMKPYGTYNGCGTNDYGVHGMENNGKGDLGAGESLGKKGSRFQLKKYWKRKWKDTVGTPGHTQSYGKEEVAGPGGDVKR